MGISRLTRLTNGFSKKWENLKAALALHFAYNNFCRAHKTVRATPAMEAGITDHVWDIAGFDCCCLGGDAMDNTKLAERLKNTGHKLGQSVVRSDGKLLLEVDGVLMFRLDAVAVANGYATVEDTKTKNKGRIFPGAPQD
jgi:hypothetical protein